MEKKEFIGKTITLYDKVLAHLAGGKDKNLGLVLAAVEAHKERMAVAEYKLYLSGGFQSVVQYEDFLKRNVETKSWEEVKTLYARMLADNKDLLESRRLKEIDGDVGNLVTTTYILYPARVSTSGKRDSIYSQPPVLAAM